MAYVGYVRNKTGRPQVFTLVFSSEISKGIQLDPYESKGLTRDEFLVATGTIYDPDIFELLIGDTPIQPPVPPSGGATGATGPTGPGGGDSVLYQEYASFATGHAWVLATGSSSDVSAISVAKTANSVTVSNITGTAKLGSIFVRFDAADITAGTATIQFPEPTGATTLNNSFLPTCVRFSAAGAQLTTAFSFANTAGTITLSCSGLTNSAINFVKLVF